MSTLTQNIGHKILYYENKAKGPVFSQIPWSCTDGRNIPIDVLMYGIIKCFVKGKYNSIVDPTCGKKNHQFSKIVDILEFWGINYIACDKDPDNWSGKICDVFCPETLPEGEVWVYDPPYLPTAREDDRKNDYAINVNRSVMEIKSYYSERVFKNFEKRGAKLIIVKGCDFYYPNTSDNFYLFLRDILTIPRGWKPIATIIYRYYNSSNILNNVRLAKALEKRNIMRAQVVHSYYVIMKKEG